MSGANFDKELKVMFPIHAEPKYGGLFYDQTKHFHGIGFDVTRLRGILDHGILSSLSATTRGILYNRNFDGFNGGTTISVTDSPSLFETFEGESFKHYVRSGIGLVIANELPTKYSPRSLSPYSEGGTVSSGYRDESYIFDQVKPANIVGAMVPAEALDTSLLLLKLGLASMGTGYVDDRCRRTLMFLALETRSKIDVSEMEAAISKKSKLKDNADNLEKRRQIVHEMDALLQGYVSRAYAHRLKIDRPTLRDILKAYIPKRMTIYNSNGFEIAL